MLIRRVIGFSFALLVMLCVGFLPARATGQLGNSGKFVGWWELGGYYGTDDSSRGEAVLFTPLMQSATTLFFLDARGKLFEEDVQEANIALGYRQMMASGWNFGIWGGWDVRDTEIDNTFHQVSFGVEALSERFDVRVNGYVPVTDPKGSPSTAEVVLQGNNIFMIGGEEVPLYGVDGEVGILLFGRNRGGGGGLKGAPAPAKRHELRGYVGGFWFDDDDAIEEVAGPKGRLEYRINDVISSLPGSRLTIESELSHDDVRDTKFEIGARLRVPFGARGSDAAARTAALTGQELRMIEGLERDTDIITVESKEENVIDVATNVAMNAVSFARNATQFAKAVDQGGNRLIILQKGSKRIDVSGTDGQQLRDNQTVQGGASTLNYRGARSGTVAAFTAPGRRPTLFTDDINENTGAITTASNTHVAGVRTRGIGNQNTFVGDNNGILIPGGTSNIVLEQLDLRTFGNAGIKFGVDGSARDVIIRDSMIANGGDEGIDLTGQPAGTRRNILITGLTIKDTGEEGINSNDVNGLTITDTTIHNVGEEGMQFFQNNRNVHIARVSISNTGEEGIQTDGDTNSNFTIEDTTIRNTGEEGIQIGFNNRNITIEDTTIRNTGDEGIELRDNVRNITIHNVDIRNAGSEGIQVFNDTRNITIYNVDITNTGLSGIDFGNNNRNVEITDSTVTGANGLGGIIFGANNSDVVVAGNTITNAVTGVLFNDFNTDIVVAGNTITNVTFDGVFFNGNNTDVVVAGNTIRNADDGIQFNGDNNDNVVIAGNLIRNTTADALRFFGENDNLQIVDNTFTGIGQNVFEILGINNTLAAGSVNNVTTDAPGGSLCFTNAGVGQFTGTIEIDGINFTNGVGCN